MVLSQNTLRLHRILTTMAATLEDVLRDPAVWRAGELAAARQPGIASGVPALDRELPERGWPVGALSEILCDDVGIGEVWLLLAAVAQIHRDGKGVVIIAPPYRPFLPAWRARGVDPARLLILDAEGQDALCAAEQAARSRACGLVALWGDRLQLGDRALRRLHLAAALGDTCCIAYRHTRASLQPSPAPLRLALTAREGRLQIRILKRRGPTYAGTLDADPFPLHWREAMQAGAVTESRAPPSEATLVSDPPGGLVTPSCQVG